ncbi:MAG: ABC transporter substrate-binding protein [Candidatus Kariarchaeaceae archaeon]|jgi:ABC-type transport system substrate-binding protein
MKLAGSIKTTLIILLLIGLLFGPPTSRIFSLHNSQLTEDPFFKATLLVAEPNPIFLGYERLPIANKIAEDLLEIGIKLTVDEVDLEELNSRIAIGDTLTPTHNETGYDFYLMPNKPFVGYSSDAYEYETSFFNSEASEVHTLNVLHTEKLNQYTNSTYDALEAQFFSEFDPINRATILTEIQDLLYDEMPAISVYHHEALVIYNSSWSPEPDFLEIFAQGDIQSHWADFSFGEKENITISSYLIPTNSVPHQYMRDIFHYRVRNLQINLAFQGLYEKQIGNPEQWQPLLAEAMPVWNEENTEAIVKLRDDVTFADGSNLTSYDVVESYLSYLTPNAALINHPNFKDLNRFLNNASIEALDDYTIKFSFSQPYIYSIRLLSRPILPIHIWGNHTNQVIKDQNPNDFMFEQIINGSMEYGIGSGPFTLHNISIENRSQMYVRNDNYWNSENVPLRSITLTQFTTVEDIINKLKTGDLDFTYLFHMSADAITQLNSAPKISYSILPSYFHQILVPNTNHPIYGTGLGTPLGTENPVLANDAARKIRQAISAAISRGDIISQILNGAGNPAVIPISYAVIDGSYKFDDYDLVKSRNLMREVGYSFPGDPETTSDMDTDDGDDGFLNFSNIIAIITVLIVLPVFAIMIKRNRTRMKNR